MFFFNHDIIILVMSTYLNKCPSAPRKKRIRSPYRYTRNEMLECPLAPRKKRYSRRENVRNCSPLPFGKHVRNKISQCPQTL